jgi:hypothetical protein
MNITAAWHPSDPGGFSHIDWVREGWEALRHHSTGVYANFVSRAPPESRPRTVTG